MMSNGCRISLSFGKKDGRQRLVVQAGHEPWDGEFPFIYRWIHVSVTGCQPTNSRPSQPQVLGCWPAFLISWIHSVLSIWYSPPLDSINVSGHRPHSGDLTTDTLLVTEHVELSIILDPLVLVWKNVHLYHIWALPRHHGTWASASYRVKFIILPLENVNVNVEAHQDRTSTEVVQ